MRFLSRPLAIVAFSLFSTIALASELTIKVVDPLQAPVYGAQVQLFGENSSRPIAMNMTSAQGIAVFNHLPDARVQIRVLAAGFAEATQTASPAAEQTRITLHPAAATETVVVSATRTPVSTDETGASIAFLGGGEIIKQKKVGAKDTLSFLPGAIV